MKPRRWVALGLCLGWIASGSCCCIVFPIDLWERVSEAPPR